MTTISVVMPQSHQSLILICNIGVLNHLISEVRTICEKGGTLYAHIYLDLFLHFLFQNKIIFMTLLNYDPVTIPVWFLVWC